MPDPVSWLRLYHSILHNKKTASLSSDKFGNWVRLLLIASENNPRGMLPELSVLCKFLGRSYACNPSRGKALLDYFVQAGLIDKRSDGSLWVHNFLKRQWMSNAEEMPISTDGSTVCSTDCCNILLDADVDTIRLSENIDTESHATESEIRSNTARKLAFSSFDRLEFVIKSSIHELASIGRLAADKYRETEPDQVEGENFTLTGQQSVVFPKRRDLKSELSAKSFADYQSVKTLWNSLPGLMHHKAFNGDDRKAFKRALERFPLSDIKIAIERYSVWRMGAADGCYREAYKWTFADFLNRKQGGVIRRLSSDDWEDTCKPFADRRKPKPVTVADLLQAAQRKY